jgi:glycosyltransferase involved in cell wall biosynthesis
LGSLGERVADGESGRVVVGDDAFVEAAIAVLRDDAVWRRWHRGALATQRGLSWDEVAQRYEALIR